VAAGQQQMVRLAFAGNIHAPEIQEFSWANDRFTYQSMDTFWAIVCIARRDPEAALMVVVVEFCLAFACASPTNALVIPRLCCGSGASAWG
jgi:hypothetical protein